MRIWKLIPRKARVDMPARTALSKVLAECAGSWIAVDRRTNELKAAAPTADALTLKIRADGLTNVAVMRAPDLNEPELVGLG